MRSSTSSRTSTDRRTSHESPPGYVGRPVAACRRPDAQGIAADPPRPEQLPDRRRTAIAAVVHLRFRRDPRSAAGAPLRGVWRTLPPGPRPPLPPLHTPALLVY